MNDEQKPQRVLVVDDEEYITDLLSTSLRFQGFAVETADACVQIHGGAGYMTEYPAQRWLRDARLGPIGGGTDEIMAEIIGRSMGF